MLYCAIILTIVLLPLSIFIISIKRDTSTRPKHASFNLKRVRQVIAGWMIADVAVSWLLILFGCGGKEYAFYPLIFHVAVAIVVFVLIFTWAKK